MIDYSIKEKEQKDLEEYSSHIFYPEPIWLSYEKGKFSINESLYAIYFAHTYDDISYRKGNFYVCDEVSNDITIASLIYDDICYYINNDVAAFAYRLMEAVKLNMNYDVIEYLEGTGAKCIECPDHSSDGCQRGNTASNCLGPEIIYYDKFHEDV